MGTPSRSPQRSRWPYLSLLPLGFGAWAPIYAGVRARQKPWVALGVLWTVMIVVAFIFAGGKGHDGLVGTLAIIGWGGAIATSFSIRAAYDRQLSSPLLAATEAGEQRLMDRRRALDLASHNPELAHEIGIGRPDMPGAVDAGLVDINNASVTAVLNLPGVTGEIATEIIEARGRVGGFASLEDMGETLDLDGGTVEALRGQVVFLPRASGA
jgi:hypothetical protein